MDGASIPQIFWTLIGGPYEGKYRFGSIVHDRYCDVHAGKSWQDVHLMFYEACLAGGTDPLQAKLIYAAVYHFGPRWSDSEKGVEELAELIPPERKRIADELERWRVNARTRASTSRPATQIGPTPSEAQYRELILAPRPARAEAAPGNSLRFPALEKWDQIRALLRERPDASLEQLRNLP